MTDKTKTSITKKPAARGAASPRAAGATARREPSPAEIALARSFAAQRRAILTRDVFLRSQGPGVVEVDLPNLGATVLMRRVSLLDLARRGADYYPFRSAVLSMIQEGRLTDAQTEGDGLEATLDLAARVALDTIVVPPPEYIEAAEKDDAEHETLLAPWQAELEEAVAAGDQARIQSLVLSRPERPTTHTAAAIAALDPDTLTAFFVEEGEEPGPDQVVLSWALPDDDGRITGEPGRADGIHPADLIVILREAHRYGPGAMGRRFRGDIDSAQALAPVLHASNGRAKAK